MEGRLHRPTPQGGRRRQALPPDGRGEKAEAELAKAGLSTLKAAKPKDPAAIAAAEASMAAVLREARDAANKAQAIEDAVYDLKAVNPNRKANIDTRSPAELLELIELKGRKVQEAIAALRAIP